MALLLLFMLLLLLQPGLLLFARLLAVVRYHDSANHILPQLSLTIETWLRYCDPAELNIILSDAEELG